MPPLRAGAVTTDLLVACAAMFVSFLWALTRGQRPRRKLPHEPRALRLLPGAPKVNPNPLGGFNSCIRCGATWRSCAEKRSSDYHQVVTCCRGCDHSGDPHDIQPPHGYGRCRGRSGGGCGLLAATCRWHRREGIGPCCSDCWHHDRPQPTSLPGPGVRRSG